MMPLDSFSIVWDASIIPGVSLAGIPLHASAVDLEAVLSKYLTDKNSSLYRFEGAPELCLSRYGLDDRGNGGYSFSIFDDEIGSELKKEFLHYLFLFVVGGCTQLKFMTLVFQASLRIDLFTRGFCLSA